MLTMDGVGEWCTASTGIGRGKELTLTKRVAFSALARVALFGLHLLYGI